MVDRFEPPQKLYGRAGETQILLDSFERVAAAGPLVADLLAAMLVVAVGVVAVAGCQFAYFSAVEYLQVGVALLIEYTAPAAIVVWLWLRHGEQPRPLTLVGDTLYGVTADGSLLAVRASDGALLWQTEATSTASGPVVSV